MILAVQQQHHQCCCEQNTEGEGNRHCRLIEHEKITAAPYLLHNDKNVYCMPPSETKPSQPEFWIVVLSLSRRKVVMKGGTVRLAPSREQIEVGKVRLGFGSAWHPGFGTSCLEGALLSNKCQLHLISPESAHSESKPIAKCLCIFCATVTWLK